MKLPNKVDREDPPCPLLIRQGSLYNLTLDEINSRLGHVGKPLSTTNLDELVKNVFSAEDDGHEVIQNQSSSASSSASSSSSSSSSSASAKVVKLNHEILSKKTIDEVRNEIVDQECGNAVNINSSTRRQLTLGETTLEEFLIRAGVLSLGNQQSVTNPQPLSVFDPLILVKQQPSDWLQFHMEPGHDQHQVNIPMPMPIQAAGMDSSVHFQVSDVGFDQNHHQVSDVGYLDNQLGLPMALQDADASSSNPHLGTERKRRYPDEMMEKSIQRRQRRMIKNRESAARSRARKQAYTKQLEQDVLQLKTTNFWLKKQKEVGMLFDSHPTSGPRHQLRRTSSALF